MKYADFTFSVIKSENKWIVFMLFIARNLYYFETVSRK